MAIGTNSAVEYFGTTDTVTSSSSALVDGGFSSSADVITWVNDDDAPIAAFLFEAAFAVAPSANSFVNLYARPMNVSGVNDSDVPDGNFNHVYLGAFPINNVTTRQYVSIDARLSNLKSSQEYEFYIENNAGQTLSAAWVLKVTPKTIGPHA